MSALEEALPFQGYRSFDEARAASLRNPPSQKSCLRTPERTGTPTSEAAKPSVSFNVPSNADSPGNQSSTSGGKAQGRFYPPPSSGSSSKRASSKFDHSSSYHPYERPRLPSRQHCEWLGALPAEEAVRLAYGEADPGNRNIQKDSRKFVCHFEYKLECFRGQSFPQVYSCFQKCLYSFC